MTRKTTTRQVSYSVLNDMVYRMYTLYQMIQFSGCCQTYCIQLYLCPLQPIECIREHSVWYTSCYLCTWVISHSHSNGNGSRATYVSYIVLNDMGSVDAVEHCNIYMYLLQSLVNEYTTTTHARTAYNSRLWHQDIIVASASASDVAWHYQNGVGMPVQPMRAATATASAMAMAQHYQNAYAKGCTVI